jgi:hypothetical protein
MWGMMSLPSVYFVNQETHQQWLKRRELVEELAKWVLAHLDLSKRGSKETLDRRLDKAYQYVYEHFAIGKMKHPVEMKDPLFTFEMYNDESMDNMLVAGLYHEFQAQMQNVIQKFQAFCPDKNKIVTFEDSLVGLSAANVTKIQQVREELEKLHPNQESTWIENQMTGLVLRYNCMGAFSDNLHASVLSNWASNLNGFLECFASPFNHKFENYHSMFEEDREFGSRGSFFAMVHRAGGELKSGKYELNPPWNNEMYERVLDILTKSLQTQGIQAIIVGPNWTDAGWCCEGFCNLIRSRKDYITNSFKIVKPVEFVNDATNIIFRQCTACWVLSRTPVQDELLSRLRLDRPNPLRGYKKR